MGIVFFLICVAVVSAIWFWPSETPINGEVDAETAHSNEKTPYPTRISLEGAIPNAEPTSLQLLQKIEENTRRTSFWVSVVSWVVISGWVTAAIIAINRLYL